MIWLIVHFLLREGTNRGIIGRHRVTIDDHEVREETDHGTQIVKWPAMHRVDQNPQYVYIYTHTGAAHAIPKRAFQTEGDASAFFARAHQLWSSALSPSARA